MDTFQKFPDFINTDIRTRRGHPNGYTVTHDLMLARHQTLLPKELIKNLSILDLGCCVAATGAWVLDNGASEYVGIEIQKTFADQAIKNLSQDFPQAKWKIIQSNLEDFLNQNTRSYDVVFAGGVIYSSLHYQEIITKISKIATKAIVIESQVPEIIRKKLYNIPDSKLASAPEFYPLVEYHDSESGFGMMIHEDGSNFRISSAMPSVQSLIILLKEFGFRPDLKSYDDFKNTKHTGWPGRFGIIFEKKSPGVVKSTQNLYDNQMLDTIPWSLKIPETWEFDENVAKTFNKHAKQHIPDYERVIDLSVLACETLLKDPPNDKIIDVGCAVGKTLSKLYDHGFCNLVGVDSSQAMLDHCDPTQATYICSTDFPIEHGPYSAVLCNWTMHFMTNKYQYLQQIYQGLSPNGFLILTEKTQNHGPSLEFYHRFKRNQGLSEEEIRAKAESIKNIMFIDSVDWYMQTLADIGYTNVSIINAAPCFTSFMAFRAG